MKLENFQFDEGFHDFGKLGIPISDLQINKWIREGLYHIKEYASLYPERIDFFSSISSGNTKVFIEAYRQSDKKKFNVYVTVSQGYKRKIETEVEF